MLPACEKGNPTNNCSANTHREREDSVSKLRMPHATDLFRLVAGSLLYTDAVEIPDTDCGDTAGRFPWCPPAVLRFGEYRSRWSRT
jgi:hypothetical protein